jgi:hypothetical protein
MQKILQILFSLGQHIFQPGQSSGIAGDNQPPQVQKDGHNHTGSQCVQQRGNQLPVLAFSDPKKHGKGSEKVDAVDHTSDGVHVPLIPVIVVRHIADGPGLKKKKKKKKKKEEERGKVIDTSIKAVMTAMRKTTRICITRELPWAEL